MNKSNTHLCNPFFRNIQIFNIMTFQNNLLKHDLVPQHTPIRNKDEIKKILNSCNATREQFPIISKGDSIAKIIRLIPGDICKIIRINKTCGKYIYYRICK